MRKRIVIAGLVVASLLAARSAGAADRWLHVSVDEDNGNNTRVRVNLPFSIVERALPVLPDLRDYQRRNHSHYRSEHRRHHDSCINVNGRDFDLEDLKAVVAASRTNPQGEWGEYQGEDVTVRYTVEGTDLRLQVKDHYDDDDWTDVTVPLELAEIAAAQDENDFDLRAIAQWLVDRGEGDIVVVNDEWTRVRIWVDESPEGR